MQPKAPKSNTAVICGALDTFYLPEREDGICLYCGQYNSELALDGCCPKDRYAVGLSCRKARLLRALANTEALSRGEVKTSDIDPLEGFAWEMPDGSHVWHALTE